MSRAENVAQARMLRDDGLLLREIGERMGLAMSTVAAYLNDPDGSKQRARKDSYRGECVDCGSPTDGSNGRANAATRCRSCQVALVVEWQRARGQDVAERALALRLAGCTNVEIADALGVHRMSVSRSLKRLRDEGRDVPLSPHYVEARRA